MSKEDENDANEMKQTTSKEVQLSFSTIEKEEPTNDCTAIYYGTHRPLKCSNKKEGGFSRTNDKTRVLFYFIFLVGGGENFQIKATSQKKKKLDQEDIKRKRREENMIQLM